MICKPRGSGAGMGTALRLLLGGSLLLLGSQYGLARKIEAIHPLIHLRHEALKIFRDEAPPILSPANFTPR